MAQDKCGETEPRAQVWRRRLWRYGPAVCWVALIFCFSTDAFSSDNTAKFFGPLLSWAFPGLGGEWIRRSHALIRKSAHLTEYAILSLLIARALITSSRPVLSRAWLPMTLLALTVVALADEYHQSFVPSRTSSIYDCLIDVSGGLCALLLLVVWRRLLADKAPRD